MSVHFRRKERPKPLSHTPETYFAETPLLNSDQLVLSFVQALANKNNWSSATVPIRVPDKGVYLVEAVNGKLRAYTIVVKSDLVAITKTGKSRLLGFVVDRQSGEPVNAAQVSAMTRNGTATVVNTNSDGLAELPAPKTPGAEDLRLVVAKALMSRSHPSRSGISAKPPRLDRLHLYGSSRVPSGRYDALPRHPAHSWYARWIHDPC